MADENKLHDYLDLIEQARAEGDAETEAVATAAYKMESGRNPFPGGPTQRYRPTRTKDSAYEAMSFGDKILNDLKLAGKGLVGVGDAALSGITEMVVGTPTRVLADAGARLSGNDPAKAAEWVDQRIYQPQSEAGQQLAAGAGNAVAPVLKPVGEALQTVNEFNEGTFGPRVAQGIRDAAALAGDVATLVPGGAAVTKSVKEVARSSAAKTAGEAVARAPDEVARAAGYRVGPTDVKNATGVSQQPSVAASALEAATNRPASMVDNIRYNKPVTNDIAAQDIGLPAKTPLTDANMAVARKPHAAAYNEVREKVKATPLDALFFEDAQGAGRSNASVRELPGAAQKEVNDILDKKSMSGAQLIDTISDLRKKGWKATASDNPDTAAVGDVQLDLANALEAQLDRAAGAIDPTLGDRYRTARKGFAKIETVERARVGQDLDPQMLRRAAAKTDAIDGGLAIIADTAEAFPKVLRRDVPEASSLPGGSSLTSMATNLVGNFGGRKLLGATRGEAKAPRLGMEGPLSYYYRDPLKPTQRPMPEAPNLSLYPQGQGSPGSTKAGSSGPLIPPNPASAPNLSLYPQGQGSPGSTKAGSSGPLIPPNPAPVPNLSMYPEGQGSPGSIPGIQGPSGLMPIEVRRDAMGLPIETVEQARSRILAELLKGKK